MAAGTWPVADITIHNGTTHVEFRRSDKSVWSWLDGGLWEPAVFRGANSVIPGKAGQAARPWVADHRPLVMPTVIRASTPAGLLTLADEITAVWAATMAQPREMRVYGTLYGIPTGYYRKLNVRYRNHMLQWLTGRVRAKYSVEYECVDSPPEWVQVAV
jgi:hypothetical protein